jgi:hypothetical protein
MTDNSHSTRACSLACDSHCEDTTDLVPLHDPCIRRSALLVDTLRCAALNRLAAQVPVPFPARIARAWRDQELTQSTNLEDLLAICKVCCTLVPYVSL